MRLELSPSDCAGALDDRQINGMRVGVAICACALRAGGRVIASWRVEKIHNAVFAVLVHKIARASPQDFHVRRRHSTWETWAWCSSSIILRFGVTAQR
jgi:hypothetical protein